MSDERRVTKSRPEGFREMELMMLDRMFFFSIGMCSMLVYGVLSGLAFKLVFRFQWLRGFGFYLR